MIVPAVELAEGFHDGNSPGLVLDRGHVECRRLGSRGGLGEGEGEGGARQGGVQQLHVRQDDESRNYSNLQLMKEHKAS